MAQVYKVQIPRKIGLFLPVTEAYLEVGEGEKVAVLDPGENEDVGNPYDDNSLLPPCFSPNGAYILTTLNEQIGGEVQKTVKWWNKEGELLASLPLDFYSQLSFTPDSEYVMTVSGEVRFWPSPKEIAR